MKAVEDFQGVTHAVILVPDVLTGCTACDLRFWTVRQGRHLMASSHWSRRMAETEADVNCMSCLVRLPAYDEACTEGLPRPSETA